MRWLPFALFLLILNTVLLAMNVYAYRWAAQTFALSPAARRALKCVLGAGFAGVALGRLIEQLGFGTPVGVFLAATLTLELGVLLSVAILLVLHAGVALKRAVHRVVAALRRGAERSGDAADDPAGHEAAASSEPAEPRTVRALPRRSFALQLAAGSAFLAGGTSSVYGAVSGRRDYAIEEVPVYLPGLSRSLDGFSIVQLSDIHIGQFVGESELSTALDLVASARPDLIVLTGDLLDHDPRWAAELGRFVRRLGPLAREGVVAVSGNHDFYAGIEQTLWALEAGGADVLRNRGRVIGDGRAGFALLGVDDVQGPRFDAPGPDLDAAVSSLPKLGGRAAPALDLPRVLLCHNPRFFEDAASRVALQLSGHTHGGQINPLLSPAEWVLKHGWVAGLYEQGGSRLYVNRGFGTAGPPARIGAQPEVTRIVLTARA